MARIAILTLSVLALVTASAGVAGVQTPQQIAGHSRQIAYIESLGIHPPCCWEVSKFQHTRSVGKVESVRLIARARDAAGRRVALIAVKVHNPKRQFYARLLFKLRLGLRHPVRREQLLGAGDGYVRLQPMKPATWEDILVPGITKTIFFVVRERGEHSYCISGKYVPRQCSS